MELLVILGAIPLLVGQVFLWKGRAKPLLVMMLGLAAALAYLLLADPACANCDAAGRAMTQGFIGLIGGGLLFVNVIVAAIILMFRPRATSAQLDAARDLPL